MTTAPLLHVTAELGRSTHGAVTAADLRRAGVRDDTMRTLLRNGAWSAPFVGVYLTAGDGELARVHAAVLHAGDGAVVTGLLGARWAGMRWVPATECVHLIVPPERRRRGSASYALVRRAVDCSRLATWNHAGLSVAPPARLLVDGSRELRSLQEIRGLVLAAVADGLCRADEILALLDAGAVAGTALCRRAALDAVRGAVSPPEAEAADELLGRGFPFYVNAELWVDGELLGVADLYLKGTGVGGELDSKRWHGDVDSLDATLERHRRFERAGLALEHITPHRFREAPQLFVSRLLTRAKERLAGSTPPEPPGLEIRPRGPLLR